MKTSKTLGLFAAAATLGLLSTMCAAEAPAPAPTSTGGTAPTTGGTAPTTGGTAPTTGGTAPSTGGVATGGATGGTSTGGLATGGTATGGSATGGSATGGTAGSATGGGGTSGAGGASGAAGSAGKGGGGATGGGGMSGGGGSSGGGTAGGSGGSGGGATGTFKQVADLLGSKCAGCHKSGQSSIINLTNGDNMLYTRLTTVTSGLMDCNGVMLVDKANPSMSILPQAVQMAVNQAGCMINRMPNDCTNKGGCLSAANIQIITSWVNAGAPQ